MITVDASGGGDFADLPAAVLAASERDRIEIRPGTYSPAVIDKGIDIFADAVADLATRPTPSPLGELWVDPQRAQSLHFGPLAGTPIEQRIPSAALGLTITFQMLIVDGGGNAALSPPVGYVAR